MPPRLNPHLCQNANGMGKLPSSQREGADQDQPPDHNFGAVGRAQIVNHVGNLLRARRSCALIGDPGIGKTTIAQVITTPWGASVAWGNGIGPLKWIPYLALSQACRTEVRPPPLNALKTTRQRLAGFVLVIDDLQWVDPDTLELLPMLALDVPILTCIRTGDLSSETVTAAARQFCDVVRVGPLTSVEAMKVASSTAPLSTPTQLDEIVRSSGGNPLLIHCASSIAKDTAALEGAARLTALVTRASPRALRALAKLGLRGGPVDDRLIDVLGELQDLGLVAPSDGAKTVARHALFAEAAINLIGSKDRLDLHRELASEADNDGDRARHLFALGDFKKARTLALRAARNAASAHERADHYFIAASSSSEEDFEILVRAAEALLTAARLEDALTVVTRAQPQTSRQQLHHSAVVAEAAYWLSATERAREAIRDGLAAVEPDSDPSIVVRLRLVNAKFLARIEWDAASAIREAQTAAQIAEREGLPLAEVYSALGSAGLAIGDPRWRDWIASALEMARLEGETLIEMTSADTLFMAELIRGDSAKCRPLCDVWIDRAALLEGSAASLQFRKNQLLARFYVEGELEPLISDAYDLLQLSVSRRIREHVEAHLAMALADLGRDDDAVSVLDEAVGFNADDVTAHATALLAKAEVDWQAGRWVVALNAASRCRDLAISGFPAQVLVEPIRQWASMDLNIDPGEEMPLASFENLIGASLESSAIVSLFRSPEDRRNAGRFLDAADGWSLLSHRGTLRSRWGAGHAAMLANDSKTVHAILRPLEHELHESRRLPLLRRVRRTIRMAGGRTSTSFGSGIGPFTGAQVDALELAGRGLGTTEIARRLLVEESTVRSCIRDAMKRAGVRTKLAAAVELTRVRATSAVSHGEQRLILSELASMNEAAGDLASDRPLYDLTALPETPWLLTDRAVALAELASADDLDRALLAAARGVSLVVAVSGSIEADARARFIDALARIGRIETRSRIPPPRDIDAEMQDALRVLAGGGTVGEAASAVAVSERTLHRKLAALRSSWGAQNNAELLAKFIL